MQNLRRKTQNYNFVIQHVPGATIGATDGISRRTPRGEPIPDKEWMAMNKLEVTDTQSYPGGWFTDNLQALTRCRYTDVKPGGEQAADKQELKQWCDIFAKGEPEEDDIEWINKMIEDIDADLERCFQTEHWPGEIESLGSADGHAGSKARKGSDQQPNYRHHQSTIIFNLGSARGRRLQSVISKS